MSKIKEIRKIESSIKEIKKEKVESLEDELEEEFEDDGFSNQLFVRRHNKTSTLDATELPQTVEARERAIAKEDREEMNFRPTYVGGGANPYQSNNYTPVGSMEAGVGGERASLSQEERGSLRQAQDSPQQQQRRGEVEGERNYAGQNDQNNNERRKRNF